MEVKRYLNLWIFFFLIQGCASRIQLKSEPQNVKVDLISNESGEAKPLGETPLMLSNTDITSKQFSGPYLLRFNKEGFASKDVVISSLTNLELDLNVQLKSNAVTKKMSQLIDDLFEAQNLAQNQKYQDCVSKLDALQIEFPDLTAIYEMRGSVYMIQGKYELAKKEFYRAISLDPENKNLRALHETAMSKGK